MTQAQFMTAHEADLMSSQLLDAGIQGFVGAREQLFEQLMQINDQDEFFASSQF
jgi:transaldolase